MPNVFYAIAIVLFVLAAAAWPTTGRVSLGWLGLAFVTLGFVWPALAGVL